MEGELDNKIKCNLINHLKAKVYEPFYNPQTKTLTILAECKEVDENIKINNYEFHSIIGNPFAELIDNTLLDKMNNLISGSAEVVNKFIDNPLNVSKIEVEKTLQNHQDIARREKTVFYKDMVEQAITTSSAKYA